ncbi:MAG: hypothetical protein MRY83_19390 [Flavobacteriales bacterium]|nr:hypothetical protein [Flavobacteriales bacterium]
MNNKSQTHKKDLLEKINALIDELHGSKNDLVKDLKKIQKTAKKIYDTALILKFIQEGEEDSKERLEEDRSMINEERPDLLNDKNTDEIEHDIIDEKNNETEVDYGAIIVESSESNSSLNDTLANPKTNIAEKYQSDFSLSLNDQIYLMNALFEGSKSGLDNFMNQVKAAASKNEVELIIDSTYNELNWNVEDEAYQKLKKLCLPQ